MGWRLRRTWLLAAICLFVSAGCAKRKLAPAGAGLPTTPAISAPMTVPPTPARKAEVQANAKANQNELFAPEARRLLQEPPRMTLAPSRPPHAPAQTTRRIEKITILVDTKEGKLHPDARAAIEEAFKTLADEVLFVCPDRMRTGISQDCRFAPKQDIDGVFRNNLVALGVSASEAATLSTIASADLTAPQRDAFDIKADNTAIVQLSNTQLWHVTPRNPGEHSLELRVVFSTRIPFAGDVQGSPVLIARSVTVTGPYNFFNLYGPAIIGLSAALAALGGLGWFLWRSGRVSLFHSR